MLSRRRQGPAAARGRSRSMTAASESSRCSRPGAPTSCTDSGVPVTGCTPAGTAIAGRPATFQGAAKGVADVGGHARGPRPLAPGLGLDRRLGQHRGHEDVVPGEELRGLAAPRVPPRLAHQRGAAHAASERRMRAHPGLQPRVIELVGLGGRAGEPPGQAGHRRGLRVADLFAPHVVAGAHEGAGHLEDRAHVLAVDRDPLHLGLGPTAIRSGASGSRSGPSPAAQPSPRASWLRPPRSWPARRSRSGRTSR